MGTLIDFIMSSRILLKNCLDLFDSLETDFLSESLTCSTKEDKLDILYQGFKKLKNNVKDVRTSEIKRISNNKEQDGDHCSENGDINKDTDICNKLSRTYVAPKSVTKKDNPKNIKDMKNTTKLDTLQDKEMSPSNDASEEADILDSKDVMQDDDIIVPHDNKIDEDPYKDYELLECHVVIEELSKGTKESTSDEEFLNDLREEADKLNQIPKYKDKKPLKKDNVPSKRSKIESITKKTSEIIQDDSDEKDSNSDKSNSKKYRDRTSDIEIKSTLKTDSYKCSTDSESSDDEIKTKSSHIKRSAYKNLPLRPTRRSRRSNVMSDSDDSQKKRRPKRKSAKKVKYASTASSVSSVSNSSAEDSDASVSDLKKKSDHKRKKSTKPSKKSKKRKIDSEEESSGDVKTRKNIRKIIDKSKLSEATKNAQRSEMERRKRMDNKNKMKNSPLAVKDDSSAKSLSSLVSDKDDDECGIVEVPQDVAETSNDPKINDEGPQNEVVSDNDSVQEDTVEDVTV